MSPEGIYRLLLRAYPPDFRGQYEREMVLLFRDQCRESDVRTVGFWAAVIWDVARSAPALRLEAWRERTRTMEVIMKLAAVVTVLVGVLGILNAGVDAGAGFMGTLGGMHGLSLVLGVFASVLLLVAGGAVLRPTERGRQAARLALFASLALIEYDLIDEFNIFVNPVTIGRGMRIFKDRTALRVVSSTAYPSGVVINTYQPVKPPPR